VKGSRHFAKSFRKRSARWPGRSSRRPGRVGESPSERPEPPHCRENHVATPEYACYSSKLSLCSPLAEKGRPRRPSQGEHIWGKANRWESGRILSQLLSSPAGAMSSPYYFPQGGHGTVCSDRIHAVFRAFTRPGPDESGHYKQAGEEKGVGAKFFEATKGPLPQKKPPPNFQPRHPGINPNKRSRPPEPPQKPNK
jgi:hypothetical protein